MVTPDRTAGILQQPRRVLRLLTIACCLSVACGFSSCVAPPDASIESRAGGQGDGSASESIAAPPESIEVSAPQANDTPDSSGVGGGEKAPRSNFDSSAPVRAGGGREETVVVSAPGPQAAVPASPGPQAAVPVSPSPETITPPPDTPGPSTAQQIERPPAPPAVQETPRPAPVAYNGPTSGKLTCTGAPVVQNGEVVFGGLPAGRLQITYDTGVWDLRIRPDENSTQKVVLRNKRPGTQRNCTVQWQLVG